MKKTIAFASALLGASTALGYELAGLSAGERIDQPVPTGHVVGKDNAGTEGGTHYAGEDCGICHTPGGRAERQVFTMSGTLYEDRFGSRPLVGAEIMLEDVDGHVLSMTTNAAGNFWTEKPIGSNPRAVASHSGTTHALFRYEADGRTLVPADPADSRTWQYKAWIKQDDQVISMITVAPVGGSTGTTPRMSCGMHHSPTGSTGAAWVSRAPALAAYPKREVSFARHVRPILFAKCAPCHVPGPRMTRLTTASDLDEESSTSVDYSGGFDFTSYGGSTYTLGSGAGAQSIVKDGVRVAVDPQHPDESELLTSPTIRTPGSEVEHPGGGFWKVGDPDYVAIRQWIVEGAKDN